MIGVNFYENIEPKSFHLWRNSEIVELYARFD